MNVERTTACLASLLAASLGCLSPAVYRTSGKPSPPPEPATVAARKEPAPTAKARALGDIRIPLREVGIPAASPDNVAIFIRKLGTDTTTATEGDLAFRYASGDVVLRGGERVARRNGLRIAVANDDLRARLGASRRRTRSRTTEEMFIVCRSGTEGSIQMGRDTFVQALRYWTYDGWQTLVQRAFVGRALVVRPTILDGGKVAVELWPRFTTRGPRGAINLTQLATKVIVRDGQSIVLGGLTSGGSDVGAALFGVGDRRRTSTMTLVLTPKIGGGALPWPTTRRR